jgi:hypothetical protein
VGWKCLKKRAGEYKDEIIAQGVADAEFVARVTEYAGEIARTLDSVALARPVHCY